MVPKLGDIFKDVNEEEENQETEVASDAADTETQSPDAMAPDSAELFVSDSPDTDFEDENQEEDEDGDDEQGEFDDAEQGEFDEQYFDRFEPAEEVLIDVAPFRTSEMDNGAYAEAVSAYYEEQNYPLAIEKFQIAIKNEEDIADNPPNEIIAKSMYWQAESYVKTDAFPEAIAVLESLLKLFLQGEGEHYLVIAAERRLKTLRERTS